ncbi:precorrin-6A synthase, deacetylating [Thioflavicoccus mobilis 8321]|uniref:Precorrin-6A synthase, deacetylating n=1 Tax=Thioflavicoccus mobilis 8321 TaxID=765912 RepID=L0GRG9_9GAMM|nr:precorrin-6A synthase (deacetylating) [Thioflavicoccus mobilis]AGA89358.1 precorrin-6A synthase, deacetylating [Thioflavicoccus mobilis 8321]
MKKMLLIGIGPGHPDYLTIQAIEAMRRVDVFFFLEKAGDGKGELIRIRREILERYVPEGRYRTFTVKSPQRDGSGAYRDGVEAWYRAKADLFVGLIQDELADGECGALLLWGDPSLYDGTLSILKGLLDDGPVAFELDVIPGITSIQALTARHRIPLNRIGEGIQVTTARRLAASDPEDITNTVVMLDSNASFRELAETDLTIYWGAYLGTEDEMLVSGRLGDVAADLAERALRAKAEKGWLMDIYLLRKEDSGD